MTALQAALEAAARLFGPCEITQVLGPAVARISAHGGAEYVVKKHADRDKHDREVHAYQHWTPALGSSAPQLVAADAQALTIVTTALNGHPYPGPLTVAAHTTRPGRSCAASTTPSSLALSRATATGYETALPTGPPAPGPS